MGVTLLGFTEKEVGHMTINKWKTLFKHYKEFHNFKAQKSLFKIETEIINEEWLPE